MLDWMSLDWMLPENMHPGYIPPVVKQGVVTSSTFWSMAVDNTILRLKACKTSWVGEDGATPVHLAYAEQRLAAARQEWRNIMWPAYSNQVRE